MSDPELKPGMLVCISGKVMKLVRPVETGEPAFSDWTLREGPLDNASGKLWWVRRLDGSGEVVVKMEGITSMCDTRESSEAPGRPAPGDDPLPEPMLHYTTCHVSIIENAHGDKFVKVLLPVCVDGQIGYGVTDAIINGVLMSHVLQAASRAAFDVECMGPAQIIRAHGNLPQHRFEPGGLPPNPPLPEGET